MAMDNPLRRLPSVHELLQSPALQKLAELHGRELVADAVRVELAEMRHSSPASTNVDGAVAAEAIADLVTRRLEVDLQPRLRQVINATGIILHTNLGRAPVAMEAARAASEAAAGYLNLEIDLATGRRSSRQDSVRDWLCR